MTEREREGERKKERERKRDYIILSTSEPGVTVAGSACAWRCILNAGGKMGPWQPGRERERERER